MRPAPMDPAVMRSVELLLLDVDGVLTDGRLYFGANNHMSKSFLVRDGLGIALLHRVGVKTGLVSGRAEDFVRRRAEELRMAEIHLGVKHKGPLIDEIIARLGVDRERVAFVGDDVNDLPALARVGVPIAVADAHVGLVSRVRFQTRASGGQGAVREVADAILGPDRWIPDAMTEISGDSAGPGPGDLAGADDRGVEQ